MAGRLRRGRPAVGQSVTHSRVGRDLIQNFTVENVTAEPVQPLDGAVELLAEAVGGRLRRETGYRDIWRPAPLSVRVRSTERPVQALPEVLLGGTVPGRPTRLRLRGDAGEIADLFRGLPHRQLVILGEPGAGKTILAMLLALDLLDDRAPDAPVPVFFSLSSWNPEVRLADWMADRLLADFPDLRERYGHGIAQRLLDAGLVLPVLDGLDEAGRSSRNLVKRLDSAFTRRRGFVLTCRTGEYYTTVEESGEPLSRAVAVEIEPVTAETGAAYLRDVLADAPRWRPVLDRLRAEPDGPLATALATPLMLYLFRVTYTEPENDPAELLDESRSATPAPWSVTCSTRSSRPPTPSTGIRPTRPGRPGGGSARWRTGRVTCSGGTSPPDPRTAARR
ncbi:hypothetical protein DPM19_22750 [Actinomadura craniellae]|uniref:NACHT domain-containing protein n=1 Tax=Actinomadura craniellae TaxID=2231787 RepID=A0A365H187_9ACTN|nr:NACHT domain-containing protein [Actinomadura craniellae]RAY12841.1 hypothetical protein DPM19_22750 [Actinomadura craniellae]